MDTSDKPEKERRQPRRGTLSLDEIFEVFARDADRQLTAGPTSEDDLAKFEARTGVARMSCRISDATPRVAARNAAATIHSRADARRRRSASIRASLPGKGG